MTEREITTYRSAVFALVDERVTATAAPEHLRNHVCRLERALAYGGSWAAGFDAPFWSWVGLTLIDTVEEWDQRAGMRRWWHAFLRYGRQRGLPDDETFRIAAAWAVRVVIVLEHGALIDEQAEAKSGKTG